MYSTQSTSYSSSHWSSVDPPYSSSAHAYSPTAYHHHNHSNPSGHVASALGALVPTAAYSAGYYEGASSFTTGNTSLSLQHSAYIPVGQSISAVQPSHPHSPQSHSHSSSNNYALSPQSDYPSRAHSSYSHSRNRSHSQAHPYISPQRSPIIDSSHSGHYPQQIPLSQAVLNSQYPSTPNRPFSCDMCALSFNRQHDLKRHRETHTGEKPFLCNGGCGKTFTRKDALKRHQLVKGCGKVDESY